MVYNFMVSISLLGILGFTIINSRKLELFEGNLVSSAVKVMLFIYDVQCYVLN